MNSKTFYSNGKLLITGEYLVVDGANALALPTKKGQYLEITEKHSGPSVLSWKSFSNKNQEWINVIFDIPSLQILQASDKKSADWLQKVLLSAKNLSNDFLKTKDSISANSKLDFPRNWGLGSSSTIINNIAQWAGIDPFQLHFSVSNGSGYDIACASNNSPICYRVKNENITISHPKFNPSFRDKLFFVHLNKKQNSFNEVENYNFIKKEIDLLTYVEEVSELTNKFVNCNTSSYFEELINQHEYLLSNILQQETIKEKLFPMFKGSIKSLGAWGGDFILATGGVQEQEYFIERNFKTIINYDEMVLNDFS